MDQKNAIDTLEHLIERCRDGHNGFKEAAEKIKRTDLKTFFNEVSLERGRFAEELQNELIRMGKPDKRVSGSTEGALHRAWMIQKLRWEATTIPCSIGWNTERMWPKMRTRRRSAVISLRISARLSAGRPPVFNKCMTA
jgi:conserved hypothetical protein